MMGQDDDCDTRGNVGKNQDILLLISKFLGYRESKRSLAMVNKAFSRFFHESFLFNRGIVIDGHQQDESGIKLCQLSDFMIYYVYVSGLAGEIGVEARSLLQEHEREAIYLMKQNPAMANDLLLISRKLFSHFECMGYKADSPHIVDVLEDFISQCYEPQYIEDLLHCIEEDIKYWKDTRIHDEFILIVQREDGAVLYGRRTGKVYLVSGIASSVAFRFTLSDEISPHFMGNIFETTLLRWNGHIVYDGLMSVGLVRLSAELRAEAISAYISALDTCTLITTLPKCKLPVRVKHTDKASKKKEVLKISSEIMRKVDVIASFPISTVQHGYVVFRRIGYTEIDNPHHRVVALGTFGEHVMMTYRSLSPTLEDFLDRVIEFSRARGSRSRQIMVDAIDIVEHAVEVLKGIPNLRVNYYPPPSAEERSHSDLTNPYFKTCDYEFCRKRSMCMSCPCHTRVYCSKDCQKKDWKTHRKICSAARK